MTHLLRCVEVIRNAHLSGVPVCFPYFDPDSSLCAAFEKFSGCPLKKRGDILFVRCEPPRRYDQKPQLLDRFPGKKATDAFVREVVVYVQANATLVLACQRNVTADDLDHGVFYGRDKELADRLRAAGLLVEPLVGALFDDCMMKVFASGESARVYAKSAMLSNDRFHHGAVYFGELHALVPCMGVRMPA